MWVDDKAHVKMSKAPISVSSTQEERGGMGSRTVQGRKEESRRKNRKNRRQRGKVLVGCTYQQQDSKPELEKLAM